MGKRKKLGTEITIWMTAASVCAMLLLGIALLITFLFYSSQKAREDMEYIISAANEQFQSKMQFVQDGAIAMRKNAGLSDFFEKNHYDYEEMEKQLYYSMDLFSERNLVLQSQPLVESVYVFNNKGEFIREHYYPLTVSSAEAMDQTYLGLAQQFREAGRQYHFFEGENKINLCLNIYGDGMRQIGVCIVVMNPESVRLLFRELETYRGSSWAVYAGEKLLLAHGEEIPQTELSREEYLGNARAGGMPVLCSIKSGGFGLKSYVAVGMGSVYNVLWPTVFVFVAVLLLAMMLVAAIVFGASRRFTRPLKTVVEGLQSFGQDNLDVRMEDFPIEEFHEISTVFNKMTERIQYLITQVYEKELLVSQSQVRYLQSQINPHFQFNILAMLGLKAKIAGCEEVYQGLHAFSKLMQGRIFQEKNIKIPLRQELELVDFYLFLQNSRFAEKITYEISYGSEVVKDDLIPKLLIEPLVENAVSHGLEPKEEAGKIRVDIREREGRLHIIVEDNGVGFDEKSLGEDREPAERETDRISHTHMGLVNTKRLIRILYGEAGEMSIKGKKGEGTRVEIILPIERSGDDVEGTGC